MSFLFRRGSKKKLSTPPAVQVIATMKNVFAEDVTKNKYQLKRELVEKDPELFGAVNRLALMCSHAYKGVIVHAGHEMDEREKMLLSECQDFDRTFGIKDLFYTISFHLVRDADDIWISNTERKRGITQLQPLPIEYLTILEKKEQIGAAPDKTVITKPKLYVLNEGDEANRQIFPQRRNQKVWHFALNNRASLVKDIKQRQTFGIWSIGPLDTLKDRVLWKQLILLIDAIVRNKNVPRELFKVDMSYFVPENFEGETLEVRTDAARKAAKTYAEQIAKDFADVPPGRGYVIDKTAEVDMLEPKAVGNAGTDTIQDRVSRSILAATGAPALGLIDQRATYASELVAMSYALLFPERICDQIRSTMIKIMQEHIRSKHEDANYTDEELSKIDLKISLWLDVMQGEVIRMVSVLANIGITTRPELRALLDMDPLTAEQEKDLYVPQGPKTRSQTETPADVTRDVTEREQPITGKITPESRHDKQTT